MPSDVPGDQRPSDSRSQVAEIVAICHEFEAACLAGQTPSIEEYLPQLSEPGRSELFDKLLGMEVEVRAKAGEQPTPAEYASRFPADEQQIETVFARLATAVESGKQSIDSTLGRPSALRVRCPHCHSPIELADDNELEEITCPSCHNKFALAVDETLDYRPGTKTETHRRTIGHFELIEQLGVGGFGAVWKAHDTKLDRIVAVKIPRRSNIDREEAEKFLREARTAAQLQHANIVSVHEVGMEGDSIYIISDLIEGTSLDKWLADHRLTYRGSAELCVKITEALHYAHEKGVIHRDLKPANIMLDNAGEPHLMDFGLAKRETGEVTMTIDGAILGTPAYMSPEQARGEGHGVDRRADVYSLGVVLFELLTGERPFRGNARMMLKQVIEDDPQSPRKLDGRIPRDLETMCLKCLEKTPVRRYQSAAELKDELRRYLNGEAIHARPVNRLERAIRWCRRYPAIAAMTAAIIVLFLLGFAGVTWQWRQAESARRDTAGALVKVSRSLLENYHATAESNLAQTRHVFTREDSPGARDDALAMLSEAGSIWEQATSVLQKLGPQGQDIEDEERSEWSDRLIQLRYEAARWLSQPRLDHVQTMRLPVESSPHVAVSRDVELIAVTHGTGQILLLGKDGVVRNRIDVPPPSPNAEPPGSVQALRVALSPAADRMAVAYLVACLVDDEVSEVSEVLALSTQGEVLKRLKLPEPIQYKFGAWNHAQLAFPETNVIEFDGYTLDVDTGEVRDDPTARRTSNVQAACAEFEATFNGNRSINVRRLADGAAVEVQIPEPKSKSSIRDLVNSSEIRWVMQFGNDNRSLFVSHRNTLALIDAPTGTKSVRALVPLPSSADRPGQIPTIERLTPRLATIQQLIRLDEGVAVLMMSKDDDGKESWELSFWRTTLPAGHLASLPHPQSPNALVSEDGMVVSGGYDRKLRAFRDGKLLWSSGASSMHSRMSYRWWDYMAVGEQYLQVERVEIAPNRKCLHVTELYTPDGQLARSFFLRSHLGDGRDLTKPSRMGRGTIVATSANRRFAVVIDDATDEKDSLQLWSLSENKRIGDLGDHSSGRTIVKVSPDNQWLVVRSADSSEAQVWQLPGPTLVGEFAVAGKDTLEFDIEFLPHRPWLLVVENEYSDSAESAQVVDLQSATKICDLENVGGEYCFWSVVPATDELVGISGAGHSSKRYRVTIWNTKTGESRQWKIPTVWSSYSYGASLMLLSPDGTRLLLAGLREGDQISSRLAHVELWDLQNETMLRSYGDGQEQGEIHSVHFVQDCKWSESHDDEVVSLTLTLHHGGFAQPTVKRLHWNWSDGKEPEKQDELDERGKSIVARGRKDDVWLIRNTDEGLVFESAPGELSIVLAETGGLVFPADYAAIQRPRLPFAKKNDDATDVFPSPDGEKLAVSIVTGTPNAHERLSCLWNARTGERLAEFPDGVQLWGFDPTGHWLATSNAAGQVTVWDAHSGKPACTFQVPPVMGEFEVKIHPSGQHAAVLSKGILTLWDVEQGQQLAIIERPGHFTEVNCVSHHKKAGLVASGGDEGVILLWDRETGELCRSLPLEAAAVTGLQFNPAGDRLAFVTPDRLELIDLEGRQMWMLDGESRGWRFPVFAFHPSGDFLAAGTEDGRVVFVDADTGKLLGIHQADKTSITAIGFSQDGKHMATGSEGKRIHLWDDSGKGPCAAWDINSPITGVLFADNETLATAGEDIQLWDVPTRREILRLPVPEPPARLVSSSDGAYELLMPDQNGVKQFDLEQLESQFEQLHLGRGEDGLPLFIRTDSTVTRNWDKALDLYGEEGADESL